MKIEILDSDVSNGVETIVAYRPKKILFFLPFYLLDDYEETKIDDSRYYNLIIEFDRISKAEGLADVIKPIIEYQDIYDIVMNNSVEEFDCGNSKDGFRIKESTFEKIKKKGAEYCADIESESYIFENLSKSVETRRFELSEFVYTEGLEKINVFALKADNLVDTDAIKEGLVLVHRDKTGDFILDAEEFNDLYADKEVTPTGKIISPKLEASAIKVSEALFIEAVKPQSRNHKRIKIEQPAVAISANEEETEKLLPKTKSKTRS